MKTALFFLLIAVPALAADGYQHQTDYLGLSKLKVKTDDVVKVRKFMVEKEKQDGATVTAIMFAYRRHFSNEIKLNITANQWEHLRHAQAAFLRRGGERWELLGTDMYRDANGQTQFRY